MSERLKVLVVDDEPEIRSLLQEFLDRHYLVELASSGREAVEKAIAQQPDVILMDIMMPEMDGVTAVKELRSKEKLKHVLVMMLTAADSSHERIRAFNFGADDFIAKPINFDELQSRIQAKVSRMKDMQAIPPDVIEVGNVKMNLLSQEVSIEGKLVDLSPVEFGILKLLLLRMGIVVSRNEIMKEVWQDGRKSDRLIDAHVTSLRKKMAVFNGQLQTVYGEGYRLKDVV